MKYIKLFDSYKNSIILYHGSSVKFDTFDMSKLSRSMSQDTYGWGIYLTDSMPLSKVYATMKSEIGYIYEISVTKGDFLIFEDKPTNEQLSKIQNGLNNINMDINISGELYDKYGEVFMINSGWNLYKYLYQMFHETYFIEKQVNYGINTAKREASMFLSNCGISGLIYQLESGSKMSIEYGYEGKGYVIYDSNSLNIKGVKKVNINT